MPRRVTLTDRQKDALLRLPTSQTDLLKHYTLSDEDLGHIRGRLRKRKIKHAKPVAAVAMA
ncbi:TPA: DUF4158 domain-containing protein [Pseudomonas aeruginosa]